MLERKTKALHASLRSLLQVGALDSAQLHASFLRWLLTCRRYEHASQLPALLCRRGSRRSTNMENRCAEKLGHFLACSFLLCLLLTLAQFPHSLCFFVAVLLAIGR